MSLINKPSLTENQLANRWCISIKTLQEWRRRGAGPSYLKLGKAVRYPHEIIKIYEENHMEISGVFEVTQ